jgi:hypothetical protein
MNKEFLFLNYTAFILLFITSFIFIFKNNTSLLGYILIFITNAAFLIFILSEFMKYLTGMNYFVPSIIAVAITSSSILHFVSLIFILILFYNLHVKYSINNGVSVNIPENYKQELYKFNILMATTFTTCVILLYIFKFKFEKININFFEMSKYLSFNLISRNYILFISLILSIMVIIISSVQIINANNLSKVSTFVFNSSEVIKNNK